MKMTTQQLDSFSATIADPTRIDDDDLREMAAAIADERRRRRLADTVAMTGRGLRIGDTVELVGVSPKYLVGTRATVIARPAGPRSSKWKIRLDDNVDPRALRRFGREVRAPETILRLVSTTAADVTDVAEIGAGTPPSAPSLLD